MSLKERLLPFVPFSDAFMLFSRAGQGYAALA
jgi:hypothetical protein